MTYQVTTKHLVCSVIFIALFAQTQPVVAEEGPVEELRDAPGFFALPAELDFDNGAANGDATILRMMPLYTFPVFDTWKLVNVTIFSMADAPGLPEFPGGSSTGNATGISDLIHTSFFTPNSTGDFIWGAGLMLAMPTATDDALGSGKWDAGPAVRLTYRTGPWNLGFIAGQRWSFAGSDNRNDVSQLLIRGAVRRQLPDNWFFVYAPLISANWNSPDEKWLIPVGGGIGRTFTFNEHPWAWSVQGYYNAIKPDSAPDWVLRFAIIAAIPFGEK